MRLTGKSLSVSVNPPWLLKMPSLSVCYLNKQRSLKSYKRRPPTSRRIKNKAFSLYARPQRFFLCYQNGCCFKRFPKWVLSVGKSRDTLSKLAETQVARDLSIREAFQRSKQRSGARRIQKDLEEDGLSCCLKTILSSMKRQGLIPKAAKKYKVTTDSEHSLLIAPNLLNRDFSAIE